MATVVGRDRDLLAVREAISRHGALTLVGPGGVGKSALVSELVRPFGQRALVVDAGSIDTADLVLDRLAEAIDVDPLGPAPGADLRSRATRLGERLAATDLALVVIDHGESAGPTLVDALRTLAGRSSEVVVVLVTRVHPVQPLGMTVKLEPLDLSPTATAPSPARQVFDEAFVRAGGAPDVLAGDRAAVGRILAQTGGLPLAIIGLASRAAVIGLDALVETDPGSSTDVAEPADASDPVQSVLARSLEDLVPDCQQVFQAIGVFHSTTTSDHIVTVAGLAPERTSWAVEQLARRSLVTIQGGVIDMLPPVRRLARQRAAADGRQAQLQTQHLRWAHDLCVAVPPPSTNMVLEVAEDLTVALGTALHGMDLHAAMAIAIALDDAWRADLRHHRRLDVLRPVVDACRAAADAVPPTLPQADVVELLRLTAMAVADAVGPATAGSLLDEAGARLDRADPPVAAPAARLASLRAAWAFEEGDLDRAAAGAEAVIAAGARAGDVLARLKSVKLLADVELERGNLVRSLALARQVIREAPATMGWLRAYATSTVGSCELERGALALALAAAREVRLAGEAQGDTDLVLEADWLTAMADPTLAPLRSEDVTGERAGRSIIHIQADVARAIRLLASGDAVAAITLAADCELRADALPMQPLATDAQLLVGEAAVMLGEPVEAVRAFRQALGDAVVHGNRLRAPEALDGLADVVADLVAGRAADTLRATAATIRSTLGSVSRPKPWRAASTAVHATTPRGWVSAGALTPEGLEAVLALVSTPARPESAGPLEVLSPAEAVVADLVASGLTNRAIAERLHVSRRTVETHVAHAFQKLGVSSRTQLTRVVLSGSTTSPPA